AYAVPRPEIHRQVGNFVAVEEDFAGIRPGQTHDNIEGSGLSGSVGPQEPNDFALSDFKLNVVNDFATAVRLAQFDGLELQHTSPREPPTRFVTSRPGASSTCANHFQSRR